MISSSSNPQIKNLIQLQNKSKTRQEQKAFVAEGIKMFEEAKAGGYLIKAFVSESFLKQKQLEHPTYFNDFSYELVTDSVLKEAADTKTPQGIMAIIKKPEYDLKSMIKADNANLILLEDLRDPGNLGTIMRTAEGAGITGVILSKSSVDMYNPKVIRATMGAIYRMPFVYVDNFLEVVKGMKENQVSIYGAHLKSALPYDAVEYPKKCGILIGNEANGLSDEAADLSDQCIKIPMEGNVESLNAAIAAAILMYEVYRQKRIIK